MGNNIFNEGTAVIWGIVVLGIWLAAVGLKIAAYVLRGIGLHDLCRKRNVAAGWLAWIPVAWVWTLGAVADDHAARRGVRRRWRWILTVLYGSMILGYLLLTVGWYWWAMSITAAGDPTAVIDEMGIFFAAYIPLGLAALALAACYPVCCYKVFEEIVPEKAVKYLLLSYLVPLAFGICLIRCGRVPLMPVAEVPANEGDFVPCDLFSERTDT